MIYLIPVSRRVCGFAKVEADSIQEARSKAVSPESEPHNEVHMGEVRIEHVITPALQDLLDTDPNLK